MGDTLPGPEQYKRIRMAAQQHLREARETAGERLGMRIDFSLEDEIWAYRIHIYEKDVDPEVRRHWNHQGTEFELEEGATP